jgi:hypothetical protein
MTDIEYKMLTSRFRRRTDSSRPAPTDQRDLHGEFGWVGVDNQWGNRSLADKLMIPIDSATGMLSVGASGHAK